MRDPAYFLTFRTYGTWLHGDARGSVDRRSNGYGEPMLSRDDELLRRRINAMKYPPFRLDSAERRQAVRDAITETSALRGWNLIAMNVRTNHVHVVLVALPSPIEKVLADLKAWSTRYLRQRALAQEGVPVWAHHGSTRSLANEQGVEAAIHYTLYEQGPDLT
jgi:REP element-mobilizing transposase RayT